MTQTPGLCGSRCPPQQPSVASLVLSRHIYSWLPRLGYVSLDTLNFLWSFPVACSDTKANTMTPSKARNGLSSSFPHHEDFCSAHSRMWIKLFLPFLPSPQKGQAWGVMCITRETLLRETLQSHSCSIWEIMWGHLPSTFLLGINQQGNRNSQSWNCWFVNSRETLTWRFVQILTVCITESLQK